MIKILSGVLAGVFIGAFGYELLSRTKPELLTKIRGDVDRKVDDFMAKKSTQKNTEEQETEPLEEEAAPEATPA